MLPYKHVHFIGIGGIGMSAIALALHHLGNKVTGSDKVRNATTENLESLGIPVYRGHAPRNLDGTDCVVFSSSIPELNPELQEAKRRRLPLKHRSEMLAELSLDQWTVAVSGTHGKSTTTSLLGWIYKSCGRDPTVVVGANVGQLGGNFHMGKSRTMILEADESDASFLQYDPDRIIITNMDNDHLDRFGNMETLYQTFVSFVRRLKPGGRYYACAECPLTSRLSRDESDRAVRYGQTPDCDYFASEVLLEGPRGSRFILEGRGRKWGEVRLGLFGRHNILNAVGASALALDECLPFESVRQALSEYQGASRRFDIQWNDERVLLIDDYAHHPTEIRRTLEAARDFSSRRLLVVFQPHRFSRTLILEKEFLGAFDLADELMVTEIYAAGETPIAHVTGEHLADLIRERRSAIARPTHYLPKGDLLKGLCEKIRCGDMVLVMGAGDIGETAMALARLLKEGYRP